jgi:hypothetical protein
MSAVTVGNGPFINLLIKSDFKLKLVVYEFVMYHVDEMVFEMNTHQSTENLCK